MSEAGSVLFSGLLVCPSWNQRCASWWQQHCEGVLLVELVPRGGDGTGTLRALDRQLQVGSVVVDGLSFAGRRVEPG